MSSEITFTTDELLAATGGNLAIQNDTAGSFRIEYLAEATTSSDVFLAYPRRKQRMHYVEPGVDTHDMVAGLFAKGCRRFIIEQARYDDPQFRRKLEGMNQHAERLAFVIVVASGVEALFDLATFVRRKINPVVVAITGSVGKTTTTEMVHAILSLHGETLKNTVWNSHTATARALLGMPLDTKYAAIELSTRRTGLMQTGSRITRPDIAIITQIQHEHVRGMGGLDGIAREKLTIASYMRDDAPLIIPDAPVIRRHVKPGPRLIYIRPDAFQTISHDRHGYAFAYRGHQYRLAVPGHHNVVNALSAIEACLQIGLSPEGIARGLRDYAPVGNRWLTHEVTEDIDVINDCPNNPSPASTKASIETLVSIYPDRQKIVILSDCLELGDEETELLEDLGRFIDGQPVDVVITFGEIADTVARTISNPKIRVQSFREPLNGTKDFSRNPDQIDFILDSIHEPSAVLVKAQRITGFDQLPALLVELLRSRVADNADQPHPAPESQPARKESGWKACTKFFEELRRVLRGGLVEPNDSDLLRLFGNTDLPKSFWGFGVTLYQPGLERMMVVRAAQGSAFENIRQAIRQVPKHPRFPEFDLDDRGRCRIQVDFIVERPQAVKLAELSTVLLPDGVQSPAQQIADALDLTEDDRRAELGGSAWQVQVVSTFPAERNWTRFELGVDGLRILGEAKRRYFLPGDAYVKSILGMKQLRRHIQRLFLGDDISTLEYQKFRSLTFVSTADSWTRLYRGYPVDEAFPDGAESQLVEEDCRKTDVRMRFETPNQSVTFQRVPQPAASVSPESLFAAAQAGVRWLVEHQLENGQFVYYYDAASDSRRDHEHPDRDPKKGPYYNLLRHAGAGLTLLFYDEFCRSWLGSTDARRGAFLATTGQCAEHPSPEGGRVACLQIDDAVRARTRSVIERTCDFYVEQLVSYTAANGRRAAYPLFNRKAKLGGAGIGLYMLSLYQNLFDDRYAESASLVANHIASEIQETGEFMYYHVYLDELVTPQRNRDLFSFYYPGEAVIGLASYCRHVCDSDTERASFYSKLTSALQFLVVERPHQYRRHYTSLPADSWLMMGINDLWDIDEFRKASYADFVLNDAEQMVAHQYTEDDAIYPDYVGSFYYRYGDHPYPDGARAEGLLGAYQLAHKLEDESRIDKFKLGCDRVGWATRQLCNTPASCYAAANPQEAVGGIRFKLTRQWFRIDTIQHVASFYLKLLRFRSERVTE